MKIITAQRFQKVKEGGMGIVEDTRYVRCFWPLFTYPTKLFDDKSTGIEVEGPPTPRNIIFPEGTKFINNTRGDCFFVGKPDVDVGKVLDAKVSDNRIEIVSADALKISIADERTKDAEIRAASDTASAKVGK